MRTDDVINELRDFCRGLTDAGERSELTALIDEAESIFENLDDEIRTLNSEVESLEAAPADAGAAASQLCDWARREYPRQVDKALAAIRGGHHSDLSLVFGGR